MWFDQFKAQPWRAGRKYLGRDPAMKKLMARVGPCTLAPRRDYFIILCKSIFNQQISMKIATLLFGRFCDLFPRRKPTPEKLIELLAHDHHAKHCGLSKQKRIYLIELAKHFIDGSIPTRKLSRMSDEQVIECLTRVKGIGQWTAEMFLIFVLNRPDVWPVDDLGLREGARVAFNLPARPSAKELRAIGERFKPHRTLATWYLWRGVAPAPVAQKSRGRKPRPKMPRPKMPRPKMPRTKMPRPKEAPYQDAPPQRSPSTASSVTEGSVFSA